MNVIECPHQRIGTVLKNLYSVVFLEDEPVFSVVRPGLFTILQRITP